MQVLKNIGLSNYVNPNLLDNWYFVGGGSQQGGHQFPINQRGQTVYSGANTYAFDRWYTKEGYVTAQIQSDGIKLSRSSGSWYTICQEIENPTQYIGKKLTLSLLYSGATTLPIRIRLIGDSSTQIFDIASSTGGLLSTSGVVPSGISRLWVSIYIDLHDTIVAHAMKLELGDTQTLAHQENGVWVLNELPNYAEQLHRCKSSKADSGDTYANKNVAYSNDMLTIRGKQVTIPANSDHLAISPTSVSGYTFFCWLAPASSGWIGFLYIEDPSVSNTNVWALNTATSARNVNLAMVYIKN